MKKSNSRDSVKENEMPNEEKGGKRRSPSEDTQIADSESSGMSSERSNSVELISAKLDEIDITGDDAFRMPPPNLTKKASKKVRNKQKKQFLEESSYEAAPLRITRSKIKQEKMSIDSLAPQSTVETFMPPPVAVQDKQPDSSENITKKVQKKVKQ